MKKDNYKKQFIILIFCYLTGCTHINEKIDNLPYRATKIKINKMLGKPYQIRRIDGMDYWVYKFTIEGKHYTRTIVMRKGILYKTGKLKPHTLKSL